jgi:hypothetical protein
MMASMAYQSTVEMIERTNDTRQFYLICSSGLGYFSAFFAIVTN